MKNKNKFVTFVFLKEFFDVVIGLNVPSKDLVKDGKYPLISGGKTPMGRYNKFNQSKNTIFDLHIKQKNMLKDKEKLEKLLNYSF